MAGPNRRDELATQRWLRSWPVGELPIDSPAFRLAAARWRVRRRTRRYAMWAACVVIATSLWVGHLLRLGSFGPEGAAIALCVGVAAVQASVTRRAESRLAADSQVRLAPGVARSVRVMLGPTVLVASVVLALGQLAWLGVVVARGVDGRAVLAAIVALVIWAAAGHGVFDALHRPMLAFDDSTRELDDWLRKGDAIGACGVVCVISYIFAVVIMSPIVVVLFLGSLGLQIVVWGARIDSGAGGSDAADSRRGGPVLFW